MPSISKIQKAVFLTAMTTIVVASFVEAGVFILRVQAVRPIDPHEYGQDPVVFHFRLAVFCCAILSSAFFTFDRHWSSLAICSMPFLLFARWLSVFHERWQNAVGIDPTIGTDFGIPPGHFFSFFLLRGGLVSWDLLALLVFVGLILWQLTIVFFTKSRHK